MAERPQPDLDRVREALREHDERRETEETPPEPPPEDDRRDDGDGED
jgi:hypothetical protein